MGYSQYFSTEELEELSTKNREERWQRAYRFVQEVIEGRDYRIRVSPRIAFDQHNIRPDNFDVAEFSLDNRQGTYSMKVIAMYHDTAPVLPNDNKVDPNNPLDYLEIENILVVFQCQYNLNNTLENVSAFVDVNPMGDGGIDIEVGDS